MSVIKPLTAEEHLERAQQMLRQADSALSNQNDEHAKVLCALANTHIRMYEILSR